MVILERFPHPRPWFVTIHQILDMKGALEIFWLHFPSVYIARNFPTKFLGDVNMTVFKKMKADLPE